MAVRIGGYVIHGNNVATLGRCLDDLQAVCDGVVAVDSASHDGSADLVDSRGIRRVVYPWRGYGAARAHAVQQLPDVDYIFFLDSDETLGAGAAAAFARWRASSPSLPHYTVRRRDWVQAGTRRFIFRTETRKRLIRRDAAVWTPDMIVHEALPRRPRAPLGVYIDHLFCDDLGGLTAKLHTYAFLWAVRFMDAPQGPPALLEARRLAYVLRNALFKGALWRGGAAGLRLCRAIADYHTLKYRYQGALRRGAAAEAVALYRGGDYAALYALAPRAAGALQRTAPVA